MLTDGRTSRPPRRSVVHTVQFSQRVIPQRSEVVLAGGRSGGVLTDCRIIAAVGRRASVPASLNRHRSRLFWLPLGRPRGAQFARGLLRRRRSCPRSVEMRSRGWQASLGSSISDLEPCHLAPQLQVILDAVRRSRAWPPTTCRRPPGSSRSLTSSERTPRSIA